MGDWIRVRAEEPPSFFQELTRNSDSSQVGLTEVGGARYTSVLLDKVGGRRIGTAVHVCLDKKYYEEDREARRLWRKPPPNRSWWITPAHVSDGKNQIVTEDGLELRLEDTSGLADFSLFSSAVANTPCLPIATKFHVVEGYDIDAVSTRQKTQLRIESPDVPADWKIKTHHMVTMAVASYETGIAGHDETGRLLLVFGRGWRGQSGSAVIAWPDPWGNVDQNSNMAMSAHFYRENDRLIGMVLAVDAYGRQIAALPGPKIFRLIQDIFKCKESIDQEPVRRDRQGTLYVASGAVHLRELKIPAGGSLGDGGGSLGDGGGSLGDGGPGAMRPGKRALPVTGILVDGKRWLSLRERNGYGWNEFEPASPSIRQSLAKPELLRGVFEKDGKFWLSHPDEPLPPGLDYKLPGYHENGKGVTSMALVRGLGAMADPFAQTKDDISVEHTESDGTTSLRADRIGLEVLVEYKRQDDGTLSVSGTVKAQGMPEEKLVAHGLRYFTSEHFHVLLSRTGGYRIDAYLAPDRIYTIAGPRIFPEKKTDF